MKRSPFVPLLLLATAFLVAGGFQAVQSFAERRELQVAKANQEKILQQATKLRAQLEAIAKGTLDLAGKGNANAAAVVQELARRGININPKAPSTPPPK